MNSIRARAFVILSPIVLAFSAFGQTYTIDTFAGGALPPTPMPATAAAVDPYSVAADAAGNVYFSADRAVLKVDASGTLTRVAGVAGGSGGIGDGGPATSARIRCYNSRIALDSAGNLYIADWGFHRIRKVTPGGIISTVAGDGTRGYSGDNGSATSAQLSYPVDVSVDAAGNLYITDSDSNVVRKVTPGGIISTVAGNGMMGYSGDGGPAIRATLSSPSSTVADSNGNLYIADTQNYRIRKITPAGIISTVVGTGVSGNTGDGGLATSAKIGSTRGLLLDASGNLYFGDGTYLCVRKVTASGIISRVAGATNGAGGYAGDGGQALNARFSAVADLARDAAGNLYIADLGNFRVRKISADGIVSTIAGNGSPAAGEGGPATSAQLYLPNGVSVDPTSNVIIADTSANQVRKVTPGGIISTVAGSGVQGYAGDDGPAANAQMYYPNGAVADSHGNTYIADTWNHRIRKVSPQGIITTVAGNGSPGYSGDGGAAASAKLYYPSRVAVDAAGNLYIADTSNSRIRKVTPAGTISTIASRENAPLVAPMGLVLDAGGNVYVSDKISHSIYKITPEGAVSRVAGTGEHGFSGDGGPAKDARLDSPHGVAVDAAGNLYIADMGNGRVRKVTPDGIVSSIAGTPIAGYSGDGGPSTGAQLNVINDVAVDAAGRIYVADHSNSAIRVLTPSSCVFSLSSTTLQAPVEGQRFEISIETGNGCAWSTARLPKWITISGDASGSGSGSVTLVVAPNPTEPRSVVFMVADRTVTVSQASTVLAVSSGGVVNAAGYNATVAPGSIAAVFGNYLLPTGYPVTAFPLPTALGGVSFQFLDSPLAPFFYAGAMQANVQIPWELNGKTQTTVYVSGNGQTSMAKPVTLAAFAPGIFSVNGQGTGQGAILDAGYKLVDSSNPVAAGSGVIQIYCTGLGAVTNQPATGAPAPSDPLAKATTPMVVVIDEVQVTPDFVGLTPGTVGLYQVNVTVPAGVAKGNEVPVYIRHRNNFGQRSNTVTIAVR